MNKIEIIINDKPYLVTKGTLLIEACRDNQIYIPSLCYMPGAGTFAGCRLCVVEIRKKDSYKLVASCEYPINKSETFYTDSEKVKNSRRISAELLLARVASAKELLENIIQQPLKRIFEQIPSENKECLLCGLCYRACQKFGPAALNTCGRGSYKTVATPYNEANPDCIVCGICESICPTQAIKINKDENSISIWHQRSDLITCPACGKKHITEKTYLFLTQELGLPADEMQLCEDCRKTKLSSEIQNCFMKR
jgi:NADH dehydrogenase/NADH:ubiquinone oxidoreductase subunit G